MLNPFIFREARKQLGLKPGVDLFASANHHQLPRYFSQDDAQMAAGTDAFQLIGTQRKTRMLIHLGHS